MLNGFLIGFSAITACILTVYSYFLVDPNITFFQHSLWVWFRDTVVYWGYYRRDVSWVIFLCLVIVLFILHFLALKAKRFPIIKYAFIIGFILVVSYPFLSHDFFNYLFDARIFTYYGKSPYAFRALDFPSDQWTRFMHWTHRTYPYGPTFLLFSFVPSFLGMGKFSLTFLLFKTCWIGMYILAVILLKRIHEKAAVFFATHPYILIEGLVNGHNDFIALALALVGIWLLIQKRHTFWGRVVLLLGAGIKYITIPTVFLYSQLHKKKKDKKKNLQFSLYLDNFFSPLLQYNRVLFIFQLIVLIYIVSRLGIQQWYFLALFSFLPFFISLLENMSLFFLGLLLSYYPYIRLGGWDTVEKVQLQHQIVSVFLVLNLAFILTKMSVFALRIGLEVYRYKRNKL